MLILIQVLNVGSIYVDIKYWGLFTLSENILVVVCLLIYIHLMIEIVFFESLLNPGYQRNIPYFESDDQEEQGLGPRQSSLLNERLLVNYDRALEEENILNKVFPDQEVREIQQPLQLQKTDVAVDQLFEVGRVNRCFNCCAKESFETPDDAKRFLRLVKCAVYLLLASILTIGALDFYLAEQGVK
jgi:hypothetical protein